MGDRTINIVFPISFKLTTQDKKALLSLKNLVICFNYIKLKVSKMPELFHILICGFINRNVQYTTEVSVRLKPLKCSSYLMSCFNNRPFKTKQKLKFTFSLFYCHKYRKI